MIRSKSEYKEYYLCDLRKTGIINKKWYNRLTDRRFKFYKALRFTEYYNNCKNKWYHKTHHNNSFLILHTIKKPRF